MRLLIVGLILVFFALVYYDSYKVACGPIVKSDTHDKDCYDKKLSVSMEIYAYQLIVRRFILSKEMTTVDKLLEWNDKYNHDPDGLIKYAIVQADINFQHTLEIAEQRNEQPKFGIDTTYDYHELPITMKYNSHCNTEKLIKLADSLLEV